MAPPTLWPFRFISQYTIRRKCFAKIFTDLIHRQYQRVTSLRQRFSGVTNFHYKFTVQILHIYICEILLEFGCTLLIDSIQLRLSKIYTSEIWILNRMLPRQKCFPSFDEGPSLQCTDGYGTAQIPFPVSTFIFSCIVLKCNIIRSLYWETIRIQI